MARIKLAHMYYLLFLLLLTSCGPKDPVREGPKHVSKLCALLSEVEYREDLLERAPQIKKELGALVDLMVVSQEKEASSELSDQLLFELRRVYQIDGGREIMEELEQDELYRLDKHVRAAF